MHKGNRPLAGVTADFRALPEHPHQAHLAGDTYLQAAADGSGVYPVVLPALDEGFEALDVLDRLDGLLVTGSPSNLEPDRYGGKPARKGTWHDPRRDQAVLQLIPAAVEAGVPMLAICRGFQELNVAYGGTLHQQVHKLPGCLDHRGDEDAPLEKKYRPSHEMRFTAGGILEKITGETGAMVNSLHTQGVDRLGQGLEIEATAPDGLVEALSVRDSPGFALAVQWHPEWKFDENPVSMAIFRAFGNACRAYRMRHWVK